MAEDRIRIAWKPLAGGAIQTGQWFPETERKALEAWVDYGNNEYPELTHWIEKESEVAWQ